MLKKNPQVPRAINGFISDASEHERLLPFVKGNVVFVFTNRVLNSIRDKILAKDLRKARMLP